jgi:hypothetical protein
MKSKLSRWNSNGVLKCVICHKYEFLYKESRANAQAVILSKITQNSALSLEEALNCK